MAYNAHRWPGQQKTRPVFHSLDVFDPAAPMRDGRPNWKYGLSPKVSDEEAISLYGIEPHLRVVRMIPGADPRVIQAGEEA